MQTIITKINNLEALLSTLKAEYNAVHGDSTPTTEPSEKPDRRKPGRKKIGDGFDRKEYYRNYQQKMKDVTYTCECGASIKVLSKSLHMSSKKHQRYLRNSE